MGTCFKCNKSCVYVDVTKDRNIKDLFGGPCDLCRNIVCRECSKVTSSDIRALMTQSRIILYFCEGCLSSIKQIGNMKNPKEIQQKICDLEQDLRDTKQDVQQLRSELKSTVDSVPKSYAQALSSTTTTLKKEIDDIKGSAEFISQCYEDQRKELIRATDTLKKYDKENNDLKQNIKKLEVKVSLSEQKEKENKIIISGLKQERGANLPEVVKTVFKRMSMESLQIKQCYKLSERENSPISVELCSKQDKSALFKRRKEIGKITADSCGLQGGIIYFNEDLTMENQRLFKLARDARKQKTVEVAYTYNGSVYVKKTPTSPAVKILSEDSLSTAVGCDT